MKVPETYKRDFIHCIQAEYNETLKRINQYDKGTYEQKEAIKYANFLSDILKKC